MRTQGKLTEFSSKDSTEQAEVIAPGMSMTNFLSYQTPKLLDRVQPGGIGWQFHHSNTTVFLQRSLNNGVIMNRPVIPNQVDAFSVGKTGRQPVYTQSEILSTDLRHIPIKDSTSDGFQKSHRSCVGVRAIAVTHPGLFPPHPRPEPTLGGLTIKTGFILINKHDFTRFFSGFFQCLYQGPLFSPYSGSGLWTNGWPRLYRYPRRLRARHTPESVMPFMPGTTSFKRPRVQRVFARPNCFGDWRRYWSISSPTILVFLPRPVLILKQAAPSDMYLCTHLPILLRSTPKIPATLVRDIPWLTLYTARAFSRTWLRLLCRDKLNNSRSCAVLNITLFFITTVYHIFNCIVIIFSQLPYKERDLILGLRSGQAQEPDQKEF